jgi:hypothetical protein
MTRLYCNIRKIYFFTLVFLLIYSPISNTAGIDFLLVAMILSLILSRYVIGKIFFPPLFLIFGMQVYILAVSLGNMYFELDWLFRFGRIFLHFLVGVIVANVIIKKYGVNRLFWYIVLSSIVASLLVIASIAFAPLNDFLIAEFQSTQAIDSFTGARFSGLSRTYTISYPLSLTSIFSVYLYSVRAMKGVTFLSVLIITFMAAFLNARAGWLIGYGSLVLFVMFSPLIREKLSLKLLIGIIISIAFLVFFAINIDLISDTSLYLPASVALEFLINYFQGDGFVAASMQDYSAKFFDLNKEANLLQYIFGSGAFGRGEASYLYTDNGYAFLLSGVGFFGFFILIALITLIIIPNRISCVKNPFWLILVILTVSMLIYNLKEYILFSRNFLALLAFAYAAYHYHGVGHGVTSFSKIKFK